MDVKGYESNLEKYYYSSLQVYLGLRKDEFNIVDRDFMLSIVDKARKRYMELVLRIKTLTINVISNEEVEFEEKK